MIELHSCTRVRLKVPGADRLVRIHAVEHVIPLTIVFAVGHYYTCYAFGFFER